MQATQEQKNYIRLWLLFHPEYQKTKDGTVTHKNKYMNPNQRPDAIARLRKYYLKLASQGKIMQAKIYDTDGDKKIEEWPFENGSRL